jgi:hypothetical protein
MKSLTFITLAISFLAIGLSPASAQKTMEIRKAVYFDKTPPLREMELIEPGPRDRSWKDGIIRNEDSERERNDNPNPLPSGMDPVLQSEFGFRDVPGIVANFEGVDNRNQVYPPDTDGDVGPNHYFQMINLSFQIFDKQGNSLYGPADNQTLWSGFIGSWTGTNDGDPILLYDEQADRWIATQFAIETNDGTYWELVAVSETGDPLGSYYRYAFQFPVFNDYPKLGVWPDGYYLSFNMFGGYRRAAVCSLERDAMLSGDPDARMILFDMPPGSEPWSLLPADFDGTPPPDGTPNYFAYAMDDAYGSGDYISIWAFVSDWENPDNSTFEEVTRLNTEPFNSWFCNGSLGACLPQPPGGPLLEALSDRLMYRLQYRNFGDYQVMVTNHTVNADGNGHAGIRWYELRDLNDGNGWFIYQQGTYAPDEHNRWMGSVAMDGRGYMALGFSIVSPTKFPSIRYTGRSPNDPPGQMTFYEEEIMAGSGVQTGSAARWGDYSMMSVDPVDDTTFWFTTEYVERTGQVSWQTRIAGFRMVEDNIAPTEVNDLVAIANTTNSVTLQWTATGDNGTNGMAFLYDVRYSWEPITAENFDEAIQAENEPSPAESGSPESFTIKDLEFSTGYYFALKVRDRQFNFSGLSNVVQAATPGAPDVFIEENPLVQKIYPGSTGTRPYILQNNGQSDLYFKIRKDTLSTSQPLRNLGDYADRSRIADAAAVSAVADALASIDQEGGRALGDILGTYTGANNAISGIAWVGDVMFLTDMQKHYLLRYDTALQALTDTVVIHNNPFSIAWDGEYLWIGDKFGNVYAYNLDGTSAGFSFSCPTAGFSSLAWDGSRFLTNFIMESNPWIWRIDGTGQGEPYFQAQIGNTSIWQLAYVPEHHNGYFWYTNNSGKIGQMMVDDSGNGNLVNEFAAPASSSFSLSHDHSDLWYGKTGGTLYRIDDGVDEVNWMKITPEDSKVPAGEQLDLSVRFDASRFDFGSRHANMTILTNDPETPEIRVPVELQMVSNTTLGPDTSFCSHLSIVLDAGPGFAGYLWNDGATGQTHEINSTLYGNGVADIWVDAIDIGGVAKRDSISINFLDCASILEFASGLTVSVYPNPNDGRFTIEATGVEKRIKLMLTDQHGKILLVREMESPGKAIIEPGDLPAGQYFLRIDAGEGVKMERIVVF